ncbi:MAG: DUF4230 domain-containing protein [Lachnospiraceae bacterium]|nr:DUF4230 domain-containing protein [Lachnospiraceae bacterium]
MDKKGKKFKIYITVDIILLAIALCLIIILFKGKGSDGANLNTKGIDTSDEGKLFDGVQIVKEEVTIDTQILEDGFRRMGQLISEEYYFTQVEEYSSSKKILFFDSKAGFTYSYDGVVSAGIECDDVVIKKDDEKKTLTIKLPQAKIIGVDIDFDSFKIYEEKEGLWNKLDMSSYNTSLKAFEDAAKEKALQKGILNKADENAEKVIATFVDSLIDNEEYKIEYVR